MCSYTSKFPCFISLRIDGGATQLTYNAAPICNMHVGSNPVGCNLLTEQGASAETGAVVTSGGGFSNLFPRPSWQNEHVKAYLSDPHVKVPQGRDFFNRQGRGYPDLAVFSNLFLLVMNQELTALSGSSASAPLMSAIVTLWNDVRLNVGLKPLGFANPLLYHIQKFYPQAFKAGLTGSNRCTVSGLNCCDEGFEASQGWDPFTGLGAPRFNEILRVMLALHAPNRTSAKAIKDANAYLASLGLSLSLLLPPEAAAFTTADIGDAADVSRVKQRDLKGYAPTGLYAAVIGFPIILLLVLWFSRCKTFTSFKKESETGYYTFIEVNPSKKV